MTYDVVSFESAVTRILPDGGALYGGKAGPIQDRESFDAYPWDRLEELYWDLSEPEFEALVRHLPEGMKIVGGVGNGIF